MVLMLLHGLALDNGNKIAKMSSYGCVKATPEAEAVNHEYEQSSRTVIGPPSPKANGLGHQDFPPPPLISLVVVSELLPPLPPPPRRLLL